jgi:transcriptional regulator with XRE-family HTH domain
VLLQVVARSRIVEKFETRPVDSGAMTVLPKQPNPIDVHVGARVRMWRIKRKISRITLGEALGLSDQQIQKYETGTNRIGASRLYKICAVLEIPVSALFEGTLGSPPDASGMPQDIVDFMESPEGVRFVAAFGKITDRKMRRGIVRLAGRIADDAQSNASADVLQLNEPTGEPADNM